MREIISELRRDHTNIEKLLVLLETEVRRLAEPGAIGFRLMLDIMDYVMNYPDLYHHPREDLVFAKLLQRVPESRAVVEDLIEEHKLISEKMRTLAGALDETLHALERQRDDIVELAHDYSTFLRRHLEKEETEVFPMAIAALTEEDWVELDKPLSTNDPLFGGMVHVVYRNLHRQIVERAVAESW